MHSLFQVKISLEKREFDAYTHSGVTSHNALSITSPVKIDHAGFFELAVESKA